MKAKLYIGILFVLLLAGSTVKAQRDDFYFSSRINRFHRSYSDFNYYAPVFTDSYWYNYQPYSWGISIYGGGGFGISYSNNYPVYSNGYGYNNGWYEPYFGGSYYYGYNPFYNNVWFTPVVINVHQRYGWHNNFYGYYGRNHGYNNYRYSNNSYNNYNYYNNSYNRNHSGRYSSSGNSSQGGSRNNMEPAQATGSRRDRPASTGSSVNETTNVNKDKTNNGLRMGDTRRNATSAGSNGQGNNNKSNARTIRNTDRKGYTPSESKVNNSDAQKSSGRRTISGSGSNQSREKSSADKSSSSSSSSSSSKEKSTKRR